MRTEYHPVGIGKSGKTLITAGIAFPRRKHQQQIQAGLLTSGSAERFSLPTIISSELVDSSGLNRNVVPGYSGGTVTDLHRLPFSLAPSRLSRSEHLNRLHANDSI